MGAFRRELLLTILFCTVLTACIVGCVSVFTANRILQQTSEENLQLRCQATGLQINTTLNNIQRAVDLSYQEARRGLNGRASIVNDPDAIAKHAANMHAVLQRQAEYTPGCVAAYIRYAPEISTKSGVFLLRDNQGRFEDQPLTPIDYYPPEDVEHIGWYSLPRLKRASLWIAPYYNKNMERELVSYVIPLYANEKFIGVVGMDISFSYMENLVRNISVYSSGYAFLMQGRQVMVHRDFPLYANLSELNSPEDSLMAAFKTAKQSPYQIGEYDYLGQKKSFASTRLINGMDFYICAPQNEIYQDSQRLLAMIAGIILCAILFVSLLANYVSKRLLNWAITDPLTGMPNRASFLHAFRSLEQHHEEYTLFLMDLDNFKLVNDTYGHNNGDKALCHVAGAIRCIVQQPRFMARWGGDEFIGLLPSEDAARLLEELRRSIARTQDPIYGQITTSIGAVPVKPGLPLTELTRLADEALYRSKRRGRNCVTFLDYDMPPLAKEGSPD